MKERTLKTTHKGNLHIVPVIIPNWKRERADCESCQASCQSACKTSCTVSNLPCPEK